VRPGAVHVLGKDGVRSESSRVEEKEEEEEEEEEEQEGNGMR